MGLLIYGMLAFAGAAILGAISGIKIIRPTERGLVERFGKYRRFANPGFNFIIPIVDNMVNVNITEQMVDAQPQQIITDDNLNARVDAQIYFKVKGDEENVKNSQYNVNEYQRQIVSLARTTLRNIIGGLTLKSANSDRNQINASLLETLKKETASWGIDIVRTELKEIDPPDDVQATMNEVVKAENKKTAAVDFASAAETEADGAKRAAIKKAEGFKQASILEAEGTAKATILQAGAKAQSIKLENTALKTYFKDEAQLFKLFETTINALSGNSKIVITEKGISPMVLFGEDNKQIAAIYSKFGGK